MIILKWILNSVESMPFCECGNELSVFVSCGVFLEQASSYALHCCVELGVCISFVICDKYLMC